jgi:hypothetical protein
MDFDDDMKESYDGSTESDEENISTSMGDSYNRLVWGFERTADSLATSAAIAE